MATYIAHVSVDLSGKNFPSATNAYKVYDGLRIDYSAFYEVVRGNIYGNGNQIQGRIDYDTIYNYNNQVMSSWDAAGGIYDAGALSYLDSGKAKKYFKYMFSLDDSILGSTFNDKLFGYNGNDFINGDYGNDKLTGGKGYDTFYFAESHGRDTITDFNRKQDTIELHSSLATSYADVQAAASAYKKGVVLKFDYDEQIKIAKLKMKDLHKVDFDFV